jgi:hypothetical protein
MRDRQLQVLLIGFDDADALQIVSILGSFEVDFHRIPWMDGLGPFIRVREFDIIMFGYPVQDPWLAILLEAMRTEDGLSRHAGVIAIVDAEGVEQAQHLLGQGVNRVVPIDGPEDELREAVMSLLAVARRLDFRVPVELTSLADSGPTTSFCHTENISMSGMLVSCARQIEVGVPFDFAISVPDDPQPIRGTAKVARHTDPERERVLGMGASFVSFPDNHRSRLRGILARHIN